MLCWAKLIPTTFAQRDLDKMVITLAMWLHPKVHSKLNTGIHINADK